MGHRITKVLYNDLVNYGSTVEKYLYCVSNRSSDITSFYDDNGIFLFCLDDTISNNIIDAINKLFNNHEDCEPVTDNEFNLLDMKK